MEDKTDLALSCWYPLLPRRENATLLKNISFEESIFSIQNYKDILHTVCGLAKNRYYEKNTTNQQVYTFDFGNFMKEIESKRNSDLLRYMYAQDYETVKIIETVMYIGRDYKQSILDNEYYQMQSIGCCIEKYEPEHRKRQAGNPDAIVLAWMNSLGEGYNWKSKDIEIDQIYSKVPLYKYLKDAFEILGL